MNGINFLNHFYYDHSSPMWYIVGLLTKFSDTAAVAYQNIPFYSTDSMLRFVLSCA